ncbi:MAG: radical SAM protein [Methanothrix sp.]|jgi:biotin synthase-related radical SAM superfamily protein|nr:radical SAM protein [Methanothrix sp.]
MSMEMNGEIKALLVSIGSANIDNELLAEVAKTTVPSAGPGAGLESFFFKSGGHRVRLSVNKNSPLKVVRCGGDVALIKDGKTIVTGKLEPALSHCPEQAYLTLSGRCIYDCKFCPVPKLDGEVKLPDKILQLVEEARRTGRLRAISLTSGVEKSPEDEVKRAVQMVCTLRKQYDIPIGVSVYPTDTSSEELKAAGATEIKYNVETMDPEIFARYCPGLSLEYVLLSLEKAVIPNLRPISPHPLRAGDAKVERPSAERLLKLARATKKVLEDRGLRADLAETMCLPCTGCDITPQRDV